MRKEDEAILVVGGTGTVGGAALSALCAAGARVRALVRSPARLGRFPGVEPLVGDLGDSDAVRKALRGARAALYVSPHHPEEEQLGECFIRACEAARVRLVFVGVHIDAPSRLGRAVRRFLFARVMPHYAPKFRIAERARSSQADPVVLMPTNFFQNDELFGQELRDGRFVQPFERPINRVDVRDLGEAAARACLDTSLRPGAYPVVGPTSLDGADCARIWTAELGRVVHYAPDDASFQGALARELGGKKHADFVASYAALRKMTLPTSARDLADTTALLGRPPTAYAEYARALARTWRDAERVDEAV